MTDTGSDEDASSVSDTQPGDRPVSEAKRYLEAATERPERALEHRERLVELLSASGEHELEQRAAASGALAIAARTDPARLEASVPALVTHLRRELTRTVPDGRSRHCELSRATRDQLLSSIGHVLANTPEIAADIDAFTDITDAVSTDVDESALRAVAQGLFAVADDQPETLVPAAGSLGELLSGPDDVVGSLAAGALGRLAAEHPDVAATEADRLRSVLDHDDETVQHNAVEALATLVRSRPDAVAPAAGALRTLLDHEETAIQHNAAGVLGRLFADYPGAVRPAEPALRRLREHDDPAVRRVATDAVAMLTRKRP